MFKPWGSKKEERADTVSNEAEERASLEDPSVPITSENILAYSNFGGLSATGIVVNEDNALTVPAVWCAVNFISGEIASLPLHHFKRSGTERKKQNSPLSQILNGAVSDGQTSFEWLKYSMDRVLVGPKGRSLTFIEKDASGQIVNLWPLNPELVTVKFTGGKGRKKVYVEDRGNGQTVSYSQDEIIDIPFMLRADGVSSRSPITENADAIALGIAATQYGSKIFQNGGVPPFVIEGPFKSADGAKRASDSLMNAVGKAAQKMRLAFSMPIGHTIKPIGVDPEKMQLTELKQFTVSEVARIYSIPPSFLQDLTNGTFNNVEQGDLHVIKHTLRRWIKHKEQELNLKLFGRDNTTDFVEFNLDALLSGDFKTRMEGYAIGIQNAIIKPNEVRNIERLPEAEGGDDLMIQGATVPLGSQKHVDSPDEEGQKPDKEDKKQGEDDQDDDEKPQNYKDEGAEK